MAGVSIGLSVGLEARGGTTLRSFVTPTAWWHAGKGITPNGSDAAACANLVGASYPLVQGTAAYQPAIGSDSKGSYLGFDGISEFMSANALGASASGTETPISVILTATDIAMPTVHRPWSFGNSASSTYKHDLAVYSSDYFCSRATAVASDGYPHAEIAAAAGTSIRVYDGTDDILYLNASSNSDTSTATGAVTFDLFAMGCKIASGGTSQYFQMRFREAAVVPGVISPEKAATIIQFLNSKWGVW